MTRVRWNDLDEEFRDRMRVVGLLNGCGPQKFGHVTDSLLGFLRKVVPSQFQVWCDQHDFNYILGNDEADRIKADWQFYEALRRVANRAPWYHRWRWRLYAWLGYRAVRRLGQSSFHYAPSERSWEDILALVEAEEIRFGITPE